MSRRRQVKARVPSLAGLSDNSRDASTIGVATIQQSEGDANSPRREYEPVLRQAFETAGVEFIDENGGGAGVRLRKRQKKKG